VRKLIERLGSEHTVILSTHYLQEVEKSCSRVIIVNQGEIVADGTHDELVAKRPAGALRARVRGPEVQVIAQSANCCPAIRSRSEPFGRHLAYHIDVEFGLGAIEETLARLVVKNGWDLLELQRERASLEDVFRELTLGSEKEAVHA
jgi:ABC-2 type transport system ATP-binding protein